MLAVPVEIRIGNLPNIGIKITACANLLGSRTKEFCSSDSRSSEVWEMLN
jgi:hypothetical protein